MDSPRDFVPQAAYGDKLLKEYEHWNLFLCSKQVSPGAAYLFPKRVVRKWTDLTDAEFCAQRDIASDLEQALQGVLDPKRIIPFPGVFTHIVHTHLVPEYKEPLDFCGVRFEKVRFDYLYLPQHQAALPVEKYVLMRNIVRELLA